MLGLDHAVDHPETGSQDCSVRRVCQEGWLDGWMVIDVRALDVHAAPRGRVLKTQCRGQAVDFRRCRGSDQFRLIFDTIVEVDRGGKTDEL